MIRITILCDNIVGSRLGIGEHGFSAMMEYNGEVLLVDTGNGSGIIPNAMTFNKDLRKVDKIIISHGHYDHTEGLPQVLRLSGETEVWAHPGIFMDHMAREMKDGVESYRFAGLPFRREYLEQFGARFRLEAGFTEISEGVYVTGEVPRRTSFETGDPKLMERKGDVYVQDIIRDDQSLAIKTPDGLVVVFGCAHAGMINTLRHMQEQTGEERIVAVLGGTHLKFLSQEQLVESAAILKGMNPKTVAVSHCTGIEPALYLSKEFGERFTFAHVGSEFQIS